MPPSDTIAAIATPSGIGAIAVIRISGPDAFRIASALGGGGGEALRPRRASLRRLVHEGEVLDHALVIAFAGPASFTGEDIVELQCHGGSITARRVLRAVIEVGARLAEPGEFSRRALLNGKLDLVQVEAIADVILAESEAAHRLALGHLDGQLSREIEHIEEQLIGLVTLVEAAIDFSDEEHVYSIEAGEIGDRLRPLAAGIDALLSTYDAGRLRHDGVRVAIVGPPNAGKSTLLNHLLGQERALVTEVAGTTRDWIEEGLELDGLLYRLVDTAGIRESDDPIERLGVAGALECAARADALLVVCDASDPCSWGEVFASLPDRPFALVYNKSDIVSGAGPSAPDGVLSATVSLRTGEGVDALEPLLTALAGAAGLLPASECMLITRERHRIALAEVAAALERAGGAARAGLGHELVAVDLRGALDGLGALTGSTASDAVLTRIFDEFCVGK